MNDIYKEKAALRATCRKARANIDKDEKSRLDAIICENIIHSPEFSSASVILAYCPTGSEIDISPITRKAHEDGKRVAFPVCVDKGKMIFRYCSSLDELRIGAYGIPEPSERCEECIPSEDAFCIVPALAMDIYGSRMGYGGGYYDRFLSGFSGSFAVAIYDCLVFEAIPHNERDIKIDVIITEKGKRRII